jgi:hypothetical protein
LTHVTGWKNFSSGEGKKNCDFIYKCQMMSKWKNRTSAGAAAKISKQRLLSQAGVKYNKTDSKIVIIYNSLNFLNFVIHNFKHCPFCDQSY